MHDCAELKAELKQKIREIQQLNEELEELRAQNQETAVDIVFVDMKHMKSLLELGHSMIRHNTIPIKRMRERASPNAGTTTIGVQRPPSQRPPYCYSPTTSETPSTSYASSGPDEELF